MEEQLRYLQLPANELLDEFGSGRPTPGSGCAAALMGLLAAKLVRTVALLTLDHPDEYDASSATFLVERTQACATKLEGLFQEDAEAFAPVVPLRRRRDAATDPNEKRRLGREADRALKRPTDVLFEIADQGLSLVRMATSMYRFGFKNAKGDSGAAISAAIACITTCLFVINLNLGRKKAGWFFDARRRAEALHRELASLQGEAFRLVEQSRQEAARSLDLPLVVLMTENSEPTS